MNLRTLLREALTAARTAPVPSALVLLVVAAMCFAAVATVGRQAATEAAVAAELSGPAARVLTVTDSGGTGFLTGATVATLATTVGVLAPAASADPKPADPKPAAAPTNRAGELVIGSGNLPDDMNFGGAVLSGAAAGWNGAWASLNRAAVTPAECKVLYAGLPIPKGTDTAQTNGSARGVNWSMVVSKFAMDVAPLRAALPKCGTFKAVRDGATSEISVRSIAVTGAPTAWAWSSPPRPSAATRRSTCSRGSTPRSSTGSPCRCAAAANRARPRRSSAPTISWPSTCSACRSRS